MNTNVRGAWAVAREAGRRMIRHGEGGKIVNVASILGSRVLPMIGVYAITKAAVVQMTKAMAFEWARYDIQANALAPGYIETDINRAYFATDAGRAHTGEMLRQRIGTPEDLDGELMLLVSEASRFITGTVLTVDDGQTLKGCVTKAVSPWTEANRARPRHAASQTDILSEREEYRELRR